MSSIEPSTMPRDGSQASLIMGARFGGPCIGARCDSFAASLAGLRRKPCPVAAKLDTASLRCRQRGLGALRDHFGFVLRNGRQDVNRESVCLRKIDRRAPRRACLQVGEAPSETKAGTGTSLGHGLRPDNTRASAPLRRSSRSYRRSPFAQIPAKAARRRTSGPRNRPMMRRTSPGVRCVASSSIGHRPRLSKEPCAAGREVGMAAGKNSGPIWQGEYTFNENYTTL